MKKHIQVIKKIFTYLRYKAWWIPTLAGNYSDDYKNCKRHFIKVWRIHRKGFSLTDWNSAKLDNKNYKKYLSTKDYYKMHPINGRYSHWVDDKLTLKYLCAGTLLDKYLPRYYFQVDSNGTILQLPDYYKDELSIAGGGG